MTRGIVRGSTFVVMLTALSVGCDGKSTAQRTVTVTETATVPSAGADDLQRKLEEANKKVENLDSRIPLGPEDQKKREELQAELDAARKREVEAAKAAGHPIPATSARPAPPCTCKKDDPLCDCH